MMTDEAKRRLAWDLDHVFDSRRECVSIMYLTEYLTAYLTENVIHKVSYGYDNDSCASSSLHRFTFTTSNPPDSLQSRQPGSRRAKQPCLGKQSRAEEAGRTSNLNELEE